MSDNISLTDIPAFETIRNDVHEITRAHVVLENRVTNIEQLNVISSKNIYKQLDKLDSKMDKLLWTAFGALLAFSGAAIIIIVKMLGG